jgi:multimeric flavodoxin WrbA/protein-tyrosine-phosphatase
MLVLGLQGSPRKGGNTDTFLASFIKKAKEAGASVETLQVSRSGITPCRGCGYCEKKGTCVIADDPMALEVYGLMRRADVIVAASPVFFYGISAQLKGLIDRSQTLWSRKYVYKLKDPLAATRKGVLFGVAASRGRQLFDGIHLTAKYFFDAVDADYCHSMTYRGVEAKGAIADHEGIESDIDKAIKNILVPLLDRKTVLFVSQNGACRAPMAASIAQREYGHRLRTDYAGIDPKAELSPPMVRQMEQQKVDIRYRTPQPLDKTVFNAEPDLTVLIDKGIDTTSIPGREKIHWPLFDCETSDGEMLDRLYQETDTAVHSLLQTFGKNV